MSGRSRNRLASSGRRRSPRRIAYRVGKRLLSRLVAGRWRGPRAAVELSEVAAGGGGFVMPGTVEQDLDQSCSVSEDDLLILVEHWTQ